MFQKEKIGVVNIYSDKVDLVLVVVQGSSRKIRQMKEKMEYLKSIVI